MAMNLQLHVHHADDVGGQLGERLDEDSLEAERARALTFGTKAVAVSSNKALTSKFRGVCWCVPAVRDGDVGSQCLHGWPCRRCVR